MPDPIRTGLILPPALLDDPPEPAEPKVDEVLVGAEVQSTCSMTDEVATNGSTCSTNDVSSMATDTRHCEAARRTDISAADLEVKATWSVEPLLKYLKSVVHQITKNLQDKRLPTSEKLDAFVSRLVATTWRLLKKAPRAARHPLQANFTRRFQKFWNFGRNEKVRTTTPEELKATLAELIKALQEFAASPDAIIQPKPVRCVQSSRILVDART